MKKEEFFTTKIDELRKGGTFTEMKKMAGVQRCKQNKTYDGGQM